MEHHMRAEYAEGDTPGDPRAPVRRWHMVRGAEEPRALCGVLLDPAAVTQPADAWGTAAARPFCTTCGARYLREVP